MWVSKQKVLHKIAKIGESRICFSEKWIDTYIKKIENSTRKSKTKQRQTKRLFYMWDECKVIKSEELPIFHQHLSSTCFNWGRVTPYLAFLTVFCLSLVFLLSTFRLTIVLLVLLQFVAYIYIFLTINVICKDTFSFFLLSPW